MELEGLPPTVNRMYRGLRGHRYKPKSVMEYQKRTTARMREAWGTREAYSDTVALYVKFKTDNRRRWDIDNRVKALQDCLSAAGVIVDDGQIYMLHVERVQGVTTSTEITLTRHEIN